MRSLIFVALLVQFSCNGQTLKVSEHFAPGEALSELNDKRLKEVSGLAASILNPGMLWTHNDKGNDAKVFLIDEKMNIVMTCVLEGINNRDWEDIAVGPGPDPAKNYVYVGDIGDNDAVYAAKNIYRFEEPVVKEEANEITITDVDVITFRLSGQNKDTESFMIDPSTKNIYLISKRENPVTLYELKAPESKGDTLTADKLYSLNFTEIVAADINIKGDILIKNYDHVYLWLNHKKETPQKLMKRVPVEVPYIPEVKGEAIAWSRGKSGFYTLSEQKGKKKIYLYFYSKANSK